MHFQTENEIKCTKEKKRNIFPVTSYVTSEIYLRNSNFTPFIENHIKQINSYFEKLYLNKEACCFGIS